QGLSKSHIPASWEGMEMFLKQRIRQNDPRMAKVYSHFRANLEDIVKMGERSGARILLSAIPTNLKDCPPFASLHRTGLSANQQGLWENSYVSAAEQEARTNFIGALENFQNCAAIDDQYAELHFRMA